MMVRMMIITISILTITIKKMKIKMIITITIAINIIHMIAPNLVLQASHIMHDTCQLMQCLCRELRAVELVVEEYIGCLQ
jgi:hypothetical protein